MGVPSEIFCAGEKKALANDVVVDGVTGFLLEFPHHVILAQVVFPCKGLNGKIFSKVVVNITEKLFYLGITAVGMSVINVLLFQKNAVYINHELGEKGSAKKITSEFFILQAVSSS